VNSPYLLLYEQDYVSEHPRFQDAQGQKEGTPSEGLRGEAEIHRVIDPATGEFTVKMIRGLDEDFSQHQVKPGDSKGIVERICLEYCPSTLE